MADVFQDYYINYQFEVYEALKGRIYLFGYVFYF